MGMRWPPSFMDKLVFITKKRAPSLQLQLLVFSVVTFSMSLAIVLAIVLHYAAWSVEVARKDGERLLKDTMYSVATLFYGNPERSQVIESKTSATLESAFSPAEEPFIPYFFTGKRRYLCVIQNDDVLFSYPENIKPTNRVDEKLPLDADDYCSIKSVRSVVPGDGPEGTFSVHDDVEPALYQTSIRAKLVETEDVYIIRLLLQQSEYRYLDSFNLPVVPVAIVAFLLISLIFFNVYLLFNGWMPLRRMTREIARLWGAEQSYINNKGLPADLAELATSLNDSLAQLRAAQAQIYDAYASLLGKLEHKMGTVLRLAPDEDSLSRRLLGQMYSTIRSYTLGEAAFKELTLMKDECVDIRSALQGSISMLCDKHSAVLPASRNFRIRGPKSVAVWTSRSCLCDCLGELLLNAGKYSRSEVRVTVSVDKAHGTVTVIVEDDGFGFPENEERVWEPGWRANPDGEVGGTGKGLALVRIQVRACNGRIELGRSEELEGARVTLELPIRRLGHAT